MISWCVTWPVSASDGVLFVPGDAAVYVLDEIWNLVNSHGTDINGMLEYMSKRLTHKSPVVKAKV